MVLSYLAVLLNAAWLYCGKCRSCGGRALLNAPLLVFKALQERRRKLVTQEVALVIQEEIVPALLLFCVLEEREGGFSRSLNATLSVSNIHSPLGVKLV